MSTPLSFEIAPRALLADTVALVDSYAVQIVSGGKVYYQSAIWHLPMKRPTELRDLGHVLVSRVEINLIRGDPPIYDPPRKASARWPFHCARRIRIKLWFGDQCQLYDFRPGEQYVERYSGTESTKAISR